MMQSTFRRQQRLSGFSMIELITVMIVIGILGVTVMPRFAQVLVFYEAGYRDKVKATLEYARKSAVAQRRYSCVSLVGNDLLLTIDQGIPESYAVGTCPATALALPADDGDCNPAAANRVCARPGVTLAGPLTPLTFSPLGAPSAAAVYTVTGGAVQTITVEAETGHVH
jgi:MSHA pilin protein MshC